MTDRQVKLELMDKLEKIAKEISKGNDVYITKSASGVVIKKMTVGKVWEYVFCCFNGCDYRISVFEHLFYSRYFDYKKKVKKKSAVVGWILKKYDT